MLLGAAWYAEQWPESQWDPDLDPVTLCHIHLVRVYEFGWSTMVHQESKYDFAWLDHAIEKAAKHHIVVVLGTPTAAATRLGSPSKYPETLRVDAERQARRARKPRAVPLFRRPVSHSVAHGIAEQMATRYGHNPNVVGWQLDNRSWRCSFWTLGANPDFRHCLA